MRAEKNSSAGILIYFYWDTICIYYLTNCILVITPTSALNPFSYFFISLALPVLLGLLSALYVRARERALNNKIAYCDYCLSTAKIAPPSIKKAITFEDFLNFVRYFISGLVNGFFIVFIIAVILFKGLIPLPAISDSLNLPLVILGLSLVIMFALFHAYYNCKFSREQTILLESLVNKISLVDKQLNLRPQQQFEYCQREQTITIMPLPYEVENAPTEKLLKFAEILWRWLQVFSNTGGFFSSVAMLLSGCSVGFDLMSYWFWIFFALSLVVSYYLSVNQFIADNRIEQLVQRLYNQCQEMMQRLPSEGAYKRPATQLKQNKHEMTDPHENTLLMAQDNEATEENHYNH